MSYLDWVRELGSAPPFGVGDRLGSLNHLSAAARARALATVHSGESVSIAKPLTGGPSIRADDRPSYSLELFYSDEPVGNHAGPGAGTGTDHVRLDCHGINNTHIDALNHTAIDGHWYAGYPVGHPDPPSIWEQHSGIFARALHLDIAAQRQAEWASVDEPVVSAEIESALADLGTEIQPGDALLLDLGRDRYEAAGNSMRIPNRPGLGEDAARWLARQPISLLCWDFLDAKHPAEPPAAVHMLNWAIGLILVDNCDFAAARDRLSASGGVAALMVAPLPMVGATGGNVNPLLLF